MTRDRYRVPEWVEGMVPTKKSDIWGLCEVFNSNYFLIDLTLTNLSDLISRGKSNDPKSRLTLAQLKNHPFMWSVEMRKYYFSVIGDLISAVYRLYKTRNRIKKTEKLLQLPEVERQ